jgi:uncharacterized alpha-E superfamily protein
LFHIYQSQLQTTGMLSRIADALFWMNRYMERADGLCRVAAINYILALDKGTKGNRNWKPVIETFMLKNKEDLTGIENNASAVLQRMVLDINNANSLRVIVSKARENARGVQDHITKEVWEQVNQMYHMVHDPTLAARLSGSEAIDVINGFSRQTVLYTGITDITMPRGSGWNFMNLGKYIERCLQTLEITNKEYGMFEYNLDEPRDILQWRFLLLSLSGYELHLKTYRSNHYNQNVLHQVLFNENFTRSVMYSLSRIHKYLEDVLHSNRTSDNEALEAVFGRLYSKVKFVEFESLNHVHLQQFLNAVRNDLLEFSRRLSQCFFSYS